MIVEVLVELSNKNLDRVFDYSVPKELEPSIKVGIRVQVPFAYQTLEGFVLNIKEKSDIETKNIISIIDEDIVLNDELLLLGKKMQEETLSTLISCYQVMLPKALKAKNKVKINKKFEVFYRLNNILPSYTKTEQKIIEQFKNKDLISRKKLKEISPSVVKKLEDKNVLIKEEIENYRLKYKEEQRVIKELTENQKKVVDEVKESKDQVYLLHGVTGSGKTEVYMELIAHYLSQNKTSIVLVPEISLTPQMVQRFTERFGSNIAALHSALSEGEKYDEWRRIAKKEVQIVIGARSALFAPLNNLGLIIIDEEHSDSYKQDDKNPKYDAIKMAIIRAKLNKDCKVILGSATPRLETYSRAQKKVYHLLELKNRVNNRPLPDIKIIDMNQEIRTSKGHFSKPLLSKIEEKIQKQEQVILLLNRRGYSSFVTCKNCGYTIKCPNCDISLTYHKTTKNLRCHYCGYAKNITPICPECKEKSLTTLGVGTEKIEEELNNLIPSSKILRMDVDTTSKKGQHEKMITAFKNQEYNILLGTQIVAKGLDFENVTLVGIINADTSLNIPDFRSSETTFSLLSQVAGRAGRSKKEGEVILQTFNPDHYAIELVKKHDYYSFYLKEMSIRKSLGYPPYYFIVYIRLSGKDQEYVYKESLKIKKAIEKHLQNTTILGPSPAGILKVNNIFRYGITLKYKKEDNLIDVLNKLIEVYKSNRNITVDLNFEPRHF
ncbi:MAG: primosomal protein N' [Bacilli bacterium]|nr:primosomal protein N' [Bacilli bacterium]